MLAPSALPTPCPSSLASRLRAGWAVPSCFSCVPSTLPDSGWAQPKPEASTDDLRKQRISDLMCIMLCKRHARGILLMGAGLSLTCSPRLGYAGSRKPATCLCQAARPLVPLTGPRREVYMPADRLGAPGAQVQGTTCGHTRTHTHTLVAHLAVLMSQQHAHAAFVTDSIYLHT